MPGYKARFYSDTSRLLLAYLQEEGEEVGGHLLVGLGVEEGEVELGNLQGEREEVEEGKEQVLGMGVHVELQQLLLQGKRSST